jgi:hypothetical protein
VITYRSTGSIASTLSIFSSEITMHASSAFAAPDSPDRAPCGTTGTPASAAIRTAAWTCAVSRARTTASGIPAGQNIARSYR